MDKQIVSLLNSNLRVIIPDFGAFIIRQQEPKIVVFNELLRNNDGLLTDLIVKTENAEPEIAKQLVTDFTSQATKLLENGGTLTIEELGILRKDKTGSIVFIPESEINNPAQDSRKMENSNAILEMISEDDPKAENEQKDAEVQNSVETNEVKTVDHVKMAETDSEKLKFFNNRLFQLVIGIVVVNILVFGFLGINHKNAKKKVSHEVVNSTGAIAPSIQDQLSDSVMAVAGEDAAVSKNESVDESGNAAVAENLRYYIVAGCFRDEINADELVGTLIKMGFKAEKFGKIGDLYAVSFASFDDKESAVKELDRIRKESHPDAWMTRF